MPAARNVPNRKTEESFGLAACGASGDWAVDLDETTSGVRKWFVQIEGRSVYLHFGVKSPLVIEKMLDFLTIKEKGSQSSVAERPMKLAIGKNKEEPVTLLRDDEFSDRYFLLMETKNKSVIRITIAGDDLNSFVIALRQVKEDLDGAVAE